MNQGRGFPDGDDRLSKRRHRPTKLRKVAPFEATANDGDDAARKALNRATGCLDVGSLRIVNESNTTDLTGRLHHVGEAMEPSQGRGHCRADNRSTLPPRSRPARCSACGDR